MTQVFWRGQLYTAGDQLEGPEPASGERVLFQALAPGPARPFDREDEFPERPIPASARPAPPTPATPEPTQIGEWVARGYIA